MPRVYVTKDWLNQQISQMQRTVRLYASQTWYDAYWARVNSTYADMMSLFGAANERLDSLQNMVSEVEEELDAKE